MTNDRELLIDKIYTRALELSGAERSDYVTSKCTDSEMQSELNELLEAATSDYLDDRLEGVRERIWSNIVDEDESPEEDLAGQRIGHWHIERRLARGGLATVYLAQRDDGEFDQKAAFKVLRRGLDTDDVIARFRAERQILSTLDHPSIAQILDGGALPDGRPFLVLEYVDGETITNYCKRMNIDVRGCIKLMIDVLRGLHHAHRHTVVHRDIKPSNILVSREGNVALLDFGIAKLLDPNALPGSSTMTRTGVSLLTPGYGSPEQRAGEAVTTASDIYQAGMVLYEMLTGRRTEFSGRGAQATEAQPPSKLLLGSPKYRQVRGDLDAITLKAMHADPARRYGSASEMIDDLERYLDGRPVMAQPDTVAYRLNKLTRRRPWLLPGMAIATLGLVAYVITLTMYSRQLQLEEQRAGAAQAFMVDLLSSPDPYSPADPERGRNITVVEALDLGRLRIENELADQPELQATLLGSLAGAYSSLDQHHPAIEVAEKALALIVEIYGESSEPALEVLRLLGSSYNGIAAYERARHYYDRQIGVARSLYRSGDARLGAAEVAMGSFELTQGNVAPAFEFLMSGIDKLRTDPLNHAETLITAIISVTHRTDGMSDEKKDLELLDEALAVAETVYGPDSLHTANVIIAQGRSWVGLREFDRAKERYGLGLEVYDQQLGPNHVDTIKHYNNFGVLLNSAGDFAGAEDVHRQLVDRFIALRGENHRLVADNYQNLATATARQGRLDEALPIHRKAYDIYQASNWQHYRTEIPLLSIAYIELQLGNSAAAELAATTALNAFRDAVPGTFLEGVALCLAGVSKEQQGDPAVGAAMVEASHPLISQYDLTETPYPKLCRVPSSGTP